MRFFGRGSKRRVPDWIWDNKKTCAVILEELRRIAGQHYRHVLEGKERSWLESRVQAVQRRGAQPGNLSESLACMLWFYYRLRWPMKEVAERLHVPPLTLHVKLRRISAIARELYPEDCLPKKRGNRTGLTKFPIQKVIRLREVEQLSWRDIARRVGGTLDGARSAYYRHTNKPLRPARFNGEVVYKLRQQGFGFRRIAKAFGGRPFGALSAYRKFLKRSGWPDLPRPKAPQPKDCVPIPAAILLQTRSNEGQ